MRRPPLPPRLPRPPMRATAAFLAVLVVLGGAWLWLRDSSLVAVRDVTVTGVSGPDAPRVREALADAALDMTTLHVRGDELRTAVDPYPGVLSVSTDPDFPHRLRIAVHERNPIGAVVAGDQRVPVAADGTLMRTTPGSGLPEISAKALPGGSRASDPRVKRAIDVLATAPPALRARVRRVYVGDRGWTLPLRNGPILYLGDSGRLQAKWAAVTTVLADPTSRGTTYLDVRLPERTAAGGLEPLPTPDEQPTIGDDAATTTTPTTTPETTPPATGP